MNEGDRAPALWRHLYSLTSANAASSSSVPTERNIRRAEAHATIVGEGQAPGSAILITDGWAISCKSSREGGYQIVRILVPGDLCMSGLYRKFDHSIEALTKTRYFEITFQDLEGAIAHDSSLAIEIIKAEAQASAIQRQWILNIGQKDAASSISHLLCETFYRLQTRGLTVGNTCPFPLSQEHLAWATGLTSVHVNRTLQELRRQGLLELHQKQLTILDRARLGELADFDPGYCSAD